MPHLYQFCHSSETNCLPISPAHSHRQASYASHTFMSPVPPFPKVYLEDTRTPVPQAIPNWWEHGKTPPIKLETKVARLQHRMSPNEHTVRISERKLKDTLRAKALHLRWEQKEAGAVTSTTPWASLGSKEWKRLVGMKRNGTPTNYTREFREQRHAPQRQYGQQSVKLWPRFKPFPSVDIKALVTHR